MDKLEKPDIVSLRKELEKLYEDFHRDLPAGNSPQESDKTTPS